MSVARALLLAVILLGGCRLIDQRTFQRAGAAPTPAELQRSATLAAARAARPLIRIAPGQLDHDWRPDLLTAVRDALLRDPNAAFDIITPIPTARGPDAQRAAVLQGSADARAVADVIQADGVDAQRLHIGARGDAGTPGRVVMVFLRG
jgi:hypothetical protein